MRKNPDNDKATELILIVALNMLDNQPGAERMIDQSILEKLQDLGYYNINSKMVTEKGKQIFKKNPIANNELAPVIASMLFLVNHPELNHQIEKHIFDVIVEEGLFDKDKRKVTQKGLDFLDRATTEEFFLE